MEFLKKNKVILIVAALIVLFVVSIALTPKEVSFLKDEATVSEWLKDAKEDKYTIVTLAQLLVDIVQISSQQLRN